MKIKFTDPLFLLSSQTGLSVNKLKDAAALGGLSPQASQESVKLGEPIPIVFGRRRTVNSVEQGGVFIAPKATEGYFSNQAVNTTLQYKYLLVLSQGQLGQTQVRDVFQRSCRLGTTLNQAYDARAGNWNPTNDITLLASGTWSTPSFVGTGGSYDDMTTFSFESSVGEGDNTWSSQIFIFVRSGIQVTRLVDSTVGPSDNFVDLAKYLLEKSERVGDDLIDTAALTTAAKFTDANGLFFNGQLSDSQNLQDWLQDTSYNFLLRLTQTNGKFGLRPRLPYVTASHLIDTTTITPSYTFTEDHITPDGFEIEYIAIEDRTPVCFTVLWKQQAGNNFSLVRSTEVRYTGEAANGPYIQIDLSGFCTTSDHAAKVGAYALATRKYVTHHLRIKVREKNYNSLLVVGDIVRVRLRRENAAGEISFHDYVYEIERIDKTLESYLVYDLTHFPIDSQGRSKIAREVSAATGPTGTISIGQGAFDCDVNSSTDTTTVGTTTSVPINAPSSSDTDYNLPQPSDPSSPNFDGGSGSSDPTEESSYPGGINNPPDPIEEPITPSIQGYSGTPTAGDTLTFNPGCPNARITWYLIDINTGERTQVAQGVAEPYIVSTTAQQAGVRVYAEGCCPDPAYASGYGVCVDSDTVDIFDEIIDCPGGGDAGNQGTFTKVINVGTGLGTFDFTWTAYTIQDRFVISGAASYDTGFVSGTNVTVSVTKTSADPYITVTVYAPTGGTAWNYSVGCVY
jgi:hypothetical protein